MIQGVLPQLTFSFYPHQPIHADFSGGQITSDAGLLPLRAFDQRHHLTRDWAACLSDPRQIERVCHDSLALLRQRIYQIVDAVSPLWPLLLPVAIIVAIQCLREMRVCPDPAHVFIDVFAKVGYVEDRTPIVESRINQVFS